MAQKINMLGAGAALESKFTIPFDASHIVARHYEHLGPDIAFDEAKRVRKELTNPILQNLEHATNLDPEVRARLGGLPRAS
jgi:hypothetical protein